MNPVNPRQPRDVLAASLLIAATGLALATLATVPLPPRTPKETALLLFLLVFLNSVTAGVTVAEPYVRRAATRRAPY
ncbi:hypothetical protein ACFP3U_00125 [Kitasatospora misakiensis]|uniref:Uncharacterized protein n=1 Tax=Kitasatospora misakiensis TaxID=67330 RepID=A0ABW0WWU6_9ACTN